MWLNVHCMLLLQNISNSFDDKTISNAKLYPQLYRSDTFFPSRLVVLVIPNKLPSKYVSIPLPQVRAVENKVDFPTRHDWESFFRDAKDMNETLPGERPDTIHLEGLPCRWFSQKESQFPDRPSEEVLIAVFQKFGKVVLVPFSAFLYLRGKLRTEFIICCTLVSNYLLAF